VDNPGDNAAFLWKSAPALHRPSVLEAPLMHGSLLTGPDGQDRCWWCGTDPLYTEYHDLEWGTPLRDERRLFELLCLEGAQAGLSWITVLRKRDNYRRAFDGFDPVAMAAYGPADEARLLADAGIVRNRLKVGAFIANARALLSMHERGETLEELVWSHQAGGGPRRTVRDELLTTSPEAIALGKALAKRGFKFVGPTIIYAYLQSSGVVDDHLEGCFRAG
jgi:DNA-3-methyladenine glycosylase I